MKVHKCARCEGCGYVTGAFRWEIPWTRWASDPTDPSHVEGPLEAHSCPDCGGTGALIEMEGQPHVDVVFPTRRGVVGAASYADHVEAVLRTQKQLD